LREHPGYTENRDETQRRKNPPPDRFQHLETIAPFVERAQRSAFCHRLLQYAIDRAKPEQWSATQFSEDR